MERIVPWGIASTRTLLQPPAGTSTWTRASATSACVSAAFSHTHAANRVSRSREDVPRLFISPHSACHLLDLSTRIGLAPRLGEELSKATRASWVKRAFWDHA